MRMTTNHKCDDGAWDDESHAQQVGCCTDTIAAECQTARKQAVRERCHRHRRQRAFQKPQGFWSGMARWQATQRGAGSNETSACSLACMRSEKQFCLFGEKTVTGASQNSSPVWRQNSHRTRQMSKQVQLVLKNSIFLVFPVQRKTCPSVFVLNCQGTGGHPSDVKQLLAQESLCKIDRHDPDRCPLSS